MLRRVLIVGLFAGFIAGMVMAVVQHAKLSPLIAAAEVYESAAEAKEHAHGSSAGAQEHGHAAAAPSEAATEWEPAPGLQRIGFTFLADLILGVGFALMLSGGFALRQTLSGTTPNAREGLLWGLAGFAAFALAPALGLPPEPPGMVSAEILARQAWWLGTAVATVAGLGLIVFRKDWLSRVAGAALLLLPHMIGAPLRPDGVDAVPASIAAPFVAASLVTAALFWAVLGLTSGWLYARLDQRA